LNEENDEDVLFLTMIGQQWTLDIDRDKLIIFVLLNFCFLLMGEKNDGDTNKQKYSSR